MPDPIETNATENHKLSKGQLLLGIIVGLPLSLCTVGFVLGIFIYLWRYTFPITGMLICLIVLDLLFGEKGRLRHLRDKLKVEQIGKCVLVLFLLLMIACPFYPTTQWEKSWAEKQRKAQVEQPQQQHHNIQVAGVNNEAPPPEANQKKDANDEDRYRSTLLPLIKKYYGTPTTIECSWISGIDENGEIQRRVLPIITVALKGSMASHFDDSAKVCRAVYDSDLGFSYVKIKSGTHTSKDAYGNTVEQPKFLGIWGYAVIRKANWNGSPDMRALSTGYILRGAWDVKKPKDFDFNISDSKLDDLLDIMR